MDDPDDNLDWLKTLLSTPVKQPEPLPPNVVKFPFKPCKRCQDKAACVRRDGCKQLALDHGHFL